MGRIVISTNVSLDGVVSDPDGREEFRHGGWFDRMSDKDREEWARVLVEEAMSAEAVLMGRVSDAWFATRWMSREGAWADRLNGLPKYVVSATLDAPKWGGGTVLRGDVVKEVARVRQQVDGDVLVYGSAQLVHTLIGHDLVDELRLFTFPYVLGAGRRLFGETADLVPLRLTGARTVGDSLVLSTYETVRAA